MSHRTPLAPAIAIAFATLIAFAAHAAPDPAGILRANLAASGGAHWNGKAVLKQESALAGQGLTGTNLLHHGSSSTAAPSITPCSGPPPRPTATTATKPGSRTRRAPSTSSAAATRCRLAITTYRNANLWWRADFGGAQVVAGEARTEGGARYDVLTITPKGGLAVRGLVRARPRTCSRARYARSRGSTLDRRPWSDYRDVDGVKPLASEACRRHRATARSTCKNV